MTRKTKVLRINFINPKRVIVMFFSFIVLSCCDNEDDFTPLPVDFDIIATDMLNGGGEEGLLPGNYIITNQNDWNVLLNKMNSVNSDTTDSFTTTTIDFQSHIIIAVFDEVRMNPGWNINVDTIMEYSNYISVTIISTNPGSIQSWIRQPFQIVSIPITNKPIVFE